MIKKLEHFIIWSSMILIVSTFCLIMFWWLFPYKTVKIIEQPYLVSQKTIIQGDNLEYLINACNYTKKIPNVTKQFVDGIIYSTPEGAVYLPFGCHKTVVQVRVPKNLPPGEYVLKVFVAYEMNPIRTISSEYVTEKFTVIKK
jgi:hypothetical protein